MKGCKIQLSLRPTEESVVRVWREVESFIFDRMRDKTSLDSRHAQVVGVQLSSFE